MSSLSNLTKLLFASSLGLKSVNANEFIGIISIGKYGSSVLLPAFIDWRFNCNKSFNLPVLQLEGIVF